MDGAPNHQAQTQLFMRVPWVGMSDVTTFQHLGIVQIAGPPHFHSILAHTLRLYAFYCEAVASVPREPRYGRWRMAQRAGLDLARSIRGTVAACNILQEKNPTEGLKSRGQPMGIE
jgi:hypothetical protein